MKMMLRKNIRRVILTGLFLLTFPAGYGLAASENYPTRPVTLNVGYAPGGSASISAHILMESVQKYLAKPQPFIINHKPGASGMLGADYFMKQPADGYNLLWATQDHPMRLAIEPQKFSFKKEDLIYIGTFGYCPFTLTVNSESPFNTFEEFIDYAKKHPGTVTYSTTGIGTANHITGEILMKQTGTQLIHVPFIAGNQATLAMLGGHVSCTIMSAATLTPHIKGGKARVLVVFDTKRFPDIPDVPTCKEKGFDVPGPAHTYNVMIAKKGTPKPVLDILEKLLRETANDPISQAGLSRAGFIPLYQGPEETRKMVYQDYEIAREVSDRLGLTMK
jgi:tripartite-type tricarboxylate transporter receptor subunit TctC